MQSATKQKATIDLRPLPKTVDEIMAYQHESLIKRYMRDYSVPREEAESCFVEMKRFLIVCSAIPGMKVAAEQVDDLWHTFLLFTKDYQAFCHGYLGRFIHHDPAGGFPADTYSKTKDLILDLFGGINERFWPEKAHADCEGSGTSSGCGG